MSGSGEKHPDAGREVREALRTLKKEAERMAKNIQQVADSTTKYVETNAPVVSKTIDDSMARASESFKKMMSSVDRQTKPQQVQLLKNYKAFLEGQLNRVKKRLEELSK